MKFRIHRPWILVTLLAVIGTVTAAAVLLANNGMTSPAQAVNVPAPGVSTQLTEEEKEKAVRIASESGVVKTINNDQDWKAEFFASTKLDGTEGAILEAVWQDPVESSGPWMPIHCSGTRKGYETSRWTNVTRLVVFVDMENESVAGYGVTSSIWDDDPQPVLEAADSNESVKIYDVKSGDIVYEGTYGDAPTKDEFCPPGTYTKD